MLLSEDGGGAVPQPGDQDVVPLLRGEGRDLLSGHAVQRPRLAQLDIRPEDGGQIRGYIGAGRLFNRQKSD